MESHNARAALHADAHVALAARLSRYVKRLLEAEPALGLDAGTGQPFSRDDMRAFLQAHASADDDTLKRVLRDLRKRVMLRLIARDLGGLATLAEVTATTTALAEITIAHALAGLEDRLAERHGRALGAASGHVQQLHVIGMGKLGGAELNVSSDVDLIFAYAEEGETQGPRPISNHEYWTALGRRLIAALSEITADGYVFRVDMRLRPYGDGGPLATSFDALENYFVTQGREWERYAWIKARPLTGDRVPELMERVRPFVYRRHLDYNAIAALRELHRQIRHEVERRDIADNIKLGPGGIREIEFIAQVFQLIRGGREPELRTQPTLDVLAELAGRNLLPEAAAQELTDAYGFLRNLEHRLQYLDDQQTHVIPASDADRALIAEAMGLRDPAALAAALERHRGNVSRHFEAVFAAAPESEHALARLWQGALDPGRSTGLLAGLGFRDPAAVGERLRGMRAASRYREMPAASQALLDHLVPLAVEAAAAGQDPDLTLERLIGLLESVARRGAYIALLKEYPQALSRLAAMMSASPWVAQYLTAHPILLDELLDARTLYAAPHWPSAARSLRVLMDEAEGDTEKRMDVLRHFKHAQTLRLIAQDLAGLLPIETLSDHLSDLACVVLEEVLRCAWRMRPAHREAPRFAVIGYGKLGGKELGYASDLDLVFLHDDAAPDAPEHYARFAQRINNWLTTLTPAGVLYETDLRLRPDGAGGLMVSPLESYREYQMDKAWVWEHQALTRARCVAGDREIGAAFEALRISVLRKARDLVALRGAIVEMRAKLHDAHPNRSQLFDLKHDPGGIVDVEFAVQYLVLGHARTHAELTGNIGNLALLKLAARLGLLAGDRAQAAHDAYRRLRQFQHGLRLKGDRYARIAPGEVAQETRAVRELWKSVLGEER